MNKYNKILEDIEKAAITISLTKDPYEIERLRNIMRDKIAEGLEELKNKNSDCSHKK